MNPYVWAIITALVWGCVPIIEKTGLTKVPVWPAMFYRTTGAMIGFFLLGIFKYSDIKTNISVGAQGWYYLVIGGFFGAIVGNICYYHALKDGEVSKIVPIVGAFPVIGFILGILVFNESITIAKIAGLIFVMIGVALLR